MSNADYFIALGGNTGVILSYFCRAITILQQQNIVLCARSKIYRSNPQGGPPQDQYLNAVVHMKSTHMPEHILRILLKTEQILGRVRLEHWGPRTLDLDLVACGQQVQHSDFLTLPHPRMHQRHFVLLPLCDIQPTWQHPLYHQTAIELLQKLSLSDIVEHTEQWPNT